MGRDFASRCFNWGSSGCHPAVRRYLDLGFKKDEEFSMLSGSNGVKKFDKICEKCDLLDLGNNGSQLEAEDRYNPVFVISSVWGKFHSLPEHQNGQIEDYSIFIEFKRRKKEGFLIRFGNDAFLWSGAVSSSRWRVIQEPEELYEKRNSLGKVHVRFRGKKIKINKKPLDPFPNYRVFWNYISQ